MSRSLKVRQSENAKKQRAVQTPVGRIRKLIMRARMRAKRAGLEHDVKLDDLHVPTHCPVLGIPLHAATGGPLANRFSLDRIDSRKGYVKGNVQIISFRANTIKGNATAAELRAVADYVEMIERLEAITS
ncbi:hypothetical protein ABIE87_006476 [Bradyrhizobium diazoefficiens]|uniref:hypothetical protein n=1 Tax=Bradyrhizobium diazoefficiens TaxID=1355477 RepID=UPI003510F0D4